MNCLKKNYSYDLNQQIVGLGQKWYIVGNIVGKQKKTKSQQDFVPKRYLVAEIADKRRSAIYVHGSPADAVTGNNASENRNG